MAGTRGATDGYAECEDLAVARERGVLTITVMRAERRNALRAQTMVELCEVLERANQDELVGVVVLTGDGDKAFCAGGDLNAVPTAGGEVRMAQPAPELFVRWMLAFRNCGKPILAKVRGYCIGLGNEMNLLCDLTIAGASARFGQAGPRVGSTPIIGGTQLLAITCGLKRAKEVMFLCRQYSGERAVAAGLANLVVPDEELDAEVERWCQELLALSGQSLRLAKLSLSTTFDQQWNSVLYGAELGRWFGRHGDMIEGANAFLEKRTPNFRPELAGETTDESRKGPS